MVYQVPDNHYFNFDGSNMTQRLAQIHRKTQETDIHLNLVLDGGGQHDISTGIPFFDHMFTLFAVHGFFDLQIQAIGDLDVDYHHTIEDVGLVLGQAFDQALADRQGIRRYGHQVIPMDETLTAVTVDLSNRPYLVYHVPGNHGIAAGQDYTGLTKEFMQALAVKAGMNLHLNVFYGQNEHHILESMFKALGRAMDQACSIDSRVHGVLSSKGAL